MDKNKKITQHSTGDEGPRQAEREYNEEQQRFVRSGPVDRKAREAERDLNDRDRKSVV